MGLTASKVSRGAIDRENLEITSPVNLRGSIERDDSGWVRSADFGRNDITLCDGPNYRT